MTDNNSNANKRIARNSIYMSIRMVFVLCISFYTTRAILDVLGVEDYGVYNVVCGFVSMFAFLNTAMANGIQRFYNFELGRTGIDGAIKVFNSALLIQIGIAVIILALTETLGLWYLFNKMVINPDRLSAAFWVFQYSVLGFIFLIIQAPFTAAVMAHERMDFYALISTLDAVMKLLIVFVLPCINGDRLIWYGGLWTIIHIFEFVSYLVYTRINFAEIRISLPLSKETTKSMLGFSGWNLFGSLSGVMKEQGLNLVMNLFFGPVVNAARGVASQVSAGLQGFIVNIITPARPQIVQNYAQGNTDRTLSLAFSISKLSSYFLYLLSLPVLAELDFILHLWLGDNVPDYTLSFIPIIILTIFISNLNWIVSTIVHATGKMKKYQLVLGTIGIATVPLAYIALKLTENPNIALWTSFFTMLIAQIVALLLLKQLINYSIWDYLRKVAFPIVGVLITSCYIPFVIKYFFQPSFARLIFDCIASLIFSSIAIYIIGLSKEEKEMVKKTLNLLKHKLGK